MNPLSTTPTPRVRCLVYCLLLLALAGPRCFLGLGHIPFSGDEVTYAVVSEEMIDSGKVVVPTRWGQPYLNKPPLYFWFSAALRSAVGGSPELGQRALAAVAGLLTVVAVCLLGCQLFSAEVGLLAGLLLAANEDLVFYSSHGFRRGTMESALMLLFTLAALLTARWPERRSAWLGAGVAVGAMSLLKPLVGLPALALLATHHLLGTARGERRRAVTGPLLALAAAVVVWAPWHLAVMHHLGATELAATFQGELMERALTGRPRHVEGLLFYLTTITASSVTLWLFLPALAAAAVAAWWPPAARRTGHDCGWRRSCAVLVVVGAGWLAAISLAPSKLLWYAYPVYPFLVLTVAAMFAALVPRSWRSQPASLLAVAVAVGLLSVPVVWLHTRAKVEDLAVRLDHLPWTVFRAHQAAGSPGRFLLLGPARRGNTAADYYSRLMTSATRVEDPAALAVVLAEPGPVVAALDARLEGVGRRQMRDLLTTRGGRWLGGDDNAVYVDPPVADLIGDRLPPPAH